MNPCDFNLLRLSDKMSFLEYLLPSKLVFKPNIVRGFLVFFSLSAADFTVTFETAYFSKKTRAAIYTLSKEEAPLNTMRPNSE